MMNFLINNDWFTKLALPIIAILLLQIGLEIILDNDKDKQKRILMIIILISVALYYILFKDSGVFVAIYVFVALAMIYAAPKELLDTLCKYFSKIKFGNVEVETRTEMNYLVRTQINPISYWDDAFNQLTPEEVKDKLLKLFVKLNFDDLKDAFIRAATYREENWANNKLSLTNIEPIFASIKDYCEIKENDEDISFEEKQKYKKLKSLCCFNLGLLFKDQDKPQYDEAVKFLEQVSETKTVDEKLLKSSRFQMAMCKILSEIKNGSEDESYNTTIEQDLSLGKDSLISSEDFLIMLYYSSQQDFKYSENVKTIVNILYANYQEQFKIKSVLARYIDNAQIFNNLYEKDFNLGTVEAMLKQL